MTRENLTLQERRRIDWSISTFAILLALLLMFVPMWAGATGYTPPPPKPPHDREQNIKVGQTQTQSISPDMSLYNNPVQSYSSGNTYLLPSPAMAAPLPSGVCPQGDSESWSVIWGFVSFAKSSMRTEMACLDKLIAYGKATQPQPVPQAINYITVPAAEPPKVELAKPVECVAPTVKKPVKKTPAKAATSCK